jgi:nucleoside triphosphate diphosphatase
MVPEVTYRRRPGGCRGGVLPSHVATASNSAGAGGTPPATAGGTPALLSCALVLVCARALPPASTVIYIGCRMSTTGERFERAVAIMERLRAPGGCPWDREQTFDSIKPYTLEETYEVLEAIDNRDWPELAGELGDLLLQVLFYAEMAKEQASFSIDDVLDRLSTKLVNRHPHVFGDVKADTSAEVKRNWEALKVEERKKRQTSDVEGDAAAAKKHSILAGVSSAMPSLLEAYKLSSRAAQAGFDWPNVEGLFDKLNEETSELREQLQDFPAPGPRPQGRGMAGSGRTAVPEDLQARLEDEVGDLFFVLVNIARYLSLDPESALRKSNRKFKRRFQWMEALLRQTGRSADQVPMEELESLWQQAKAQEKPA